MDEKRFRSLTLMWGIGLIILQVINFISIATTQSPIYTDVTRTIGLVMSVIFIIILILFLALTLKKKIAGPIFGIIRGVFSILTFSIIDIILGVCFIISCSSFIKYIKGQQGA